MVSSTMLILAIIGVIVIAVVNYSFFILTKNTLKERKMIWIMSTPNTIIIIFFGKSTVECWDVQLNYISEAETWNLLSPEIDIPYLSLPLHLAVGLFSGCFCTHQPQMKVLHAFSPVIFDRSNDSCRFFFPPWLFWWCSWSGVTLVFDGLPPYFLSFGLRYS